MIPFGRDDAAQAQKASHSTGHPLRISFHAIVLLVTIVAFWHRILDLDSTWNLADKFRRDQHR
jgi:hypothetical protein